MSTHADYQETTQLLNRWRGGDAFAVEQLVPLVYQDLRRMARAELGRHRGHDTLQPTALVNDLFAHLIGHDALAKLENRHHFFRLSAKVMRQLLIARARAANTDKRGAGWVRDDMVSCEDLPIPENTQLNELDDALNRLAVLKPRLAQVVELRMFGGFEVEEVALLLDLDARTIYRDWALARAWLRQELGH